MQRKFLLSSIILLLVSLVSFAQTGSIKGTLTDAKTNEAMLGTAVRVEGTQIGTQTDLQGNFELARVPAGVHTVIFSFVGYTNKVISNVRVEAGKTTVINTSIAEANTTLDAVVVRGTKNKGTEVSVITEIKKIEQIAVGISAQQIQKTQDRDASAVVRRVPGVSIQDDRFVIVRGLNERYNTVMLNDAITPSTEVDTKAFSFDLIPSSAIDRMLIFKSGSADLPGEFGGGVIKIYTKTIPDGNTITAGFSLGHRSNTTFQTATTYKGSGTDFLGFDSGLRSLPSSLPSTGTILAGANTQPVIDAFKALPTYFNQSSLSVLPDFRGNIGLTRRFAVGNVELATINSLNYSFTHQRTPNIEFYRYAYNENAGTKASEKEFAYNDNAYSENVRVGAMSNWALIINPANKIEFRNLFNQLGSKETVLRNGYNNNNIELQNYSMTYEQKSIYSGQLSGTHELSDITKLTWTGGYGYTNRQEPDNRRFTSSRTLGSNDPFTINIQQSQSPTLQQAARFYSSLTENVISGRVDVEHKIGKADAAENEFIKLRAGTYLEKKDRSFAARWFGIVNANNVGDAVLTQSPAQFFNPANLSPTGLFYNEGTGYEDAYKARNELYAGYVNAYIPLTPKFNVSLGVRAEQNRQQLVTLKRGSGEKLNVDRPLLSWLPSATFSYKLNEKNQIRAAFSQTVNRPEFRELAPFPYYDFNFDVTRVGNAALKTATISNYDLRYEFYPSEGEVISIAGFYKQFTNPIEARILNAGSGIAFGVGNAEKAFSRGFELEMRKSLKGLTGSSVVDNLTLLLNASIIDSDVKTGFSGQSSDSRFLQGQSPYLINAGIYYNDTDRDFSANILYNVVGSRIFLVGDGVVFPTVYEMPRNVIDLNLTKGFGKHIEVKVGIQDLLNQPFRFYNDTNNDKTINTSQDDVFRKFKRGTTSTIGVNYKF
ncbi:TonB-dependent receptor [Flectobacillus major]|uniref:TonB-dependent receptor n=1 Tax=Flectobacillus major TaxID=103 RepID=UPI0004133544|nr:TonB-dependent receptor [Flectobacillus major]